MESKKQFAREHESLTRRFFLSLSAAGLAGSAIGFSAEDDPMDDAALLEAIEKLEYLTHDGDFKFFGRVDPKPHEMSPEKRAELGLDRDTWAMEVVADPQSDSVVENPLSKDLGTAFTFKDLMGLAKTRAVSLLGVMSCTNSKKPCGMGLWEGVPLRDVLWLAKPKSNIRRIFYYGFHNDDPKQIFQSSMPVGRALEDPPGEHPVLLCYKLNQQWLSPERGGPVRMLVPGEYGNKSVKWIQRVFFTNEYKANDTYALKNNDTESQIKTCARFIHVPETVKSGVAFPITGMAQVGMSGLSAVQFCWTPKGASLAEDDPYFTQADWQNAEILNPPKNWGGGVKDGKISPPPVQFDRKSGEPLEWPIRYAIAHWAAIAPGLKTGRYDLRCRTIDANGVAQPMPRPFRKSGNNMIDRVSLIVEP